MLRENMHYEQHSSYMHFFLDYHVLLFSTAVVPADSTPAPCGGGGGGRGIGRLALRHKAAEPDPANRQAAAVLRRLQVDGGVSRRRGRRLGGGDELRYHFQN